MIVVVERAVAVVVVILVVRDLAMKIALIFVLMVALALVKVTPEAGNFLCDGVVLKSFFSTTSFQFAKIWK